MSRSFTIHKGKKSQVEHFLNARKRMLEELRSTQQRLEEVDEIGSVLYLNDSSATSVMSTLDSLRCITDPVVWICQSTPYDRDFILLSRIVRHKVKAIIVCGGDANDVKNSLSESTSHFETCSDMATAVEAAKKVAKAGDAVLFSPSCSAGRHYPDTAARGQHFRELVADLRQEL